LIFRGGVLLGILLLGVMMLGYGYEQTWRLFGFPTMMPSFSDARVMTAGSESYQLGHDPMENNVRDPWQRRMNYPRCWQILYLMKVDQSFTVPLALSFIVPFFASLWLFEPKNGWVAGLLLLLLFSPAVMLGVERGNSDLLIFAMILALAVWLQKWPRAAGGLLFFAAFLKLFPIFAGLALLGLTRDKAVRIGTVVLLAFVAYVLVEASNLYEAAKVTEKTPLMAFGTAVLVMAAPMILGIADPAFLQTATWFVVAVVVMAAVGLRIARSGDQDADADLRCFWAGIAIYLGSFVGLSSNYDYRLVFVIMGVPQLIKWSGAADGWIKWSARIMIGALVFSTWSILMFNHAGGIDSFRFRAIYWVDQTCKWLIFANGFCLLLATLPGWFPWRTFAKEPASAG